MHIKENIRQQFWSTFAMLHFTSSICQIGQNCACATGVLWVTAELLPSNDRFLEYVLWLFGYVKMKMLMTPKKKKEKKVSLHNALQATHLRVDMRPLVKKGLQFTH